MVKSPTRMTRIGRGASAAWAAENDWPQKKPERMSRQVRRFLVPLAID